MTVNLLTPEHIAAVKNMRLVASKIVEGTISGMHKSSYHGFNVEFAEHRQYMPGDDIKYIDWKLYGKSERYYVKQFEEETSLKCHIFLDISGSMGYKSERCSLSKFEYGKILAAALCYLMISQHDSVGLGVFSDSLHNYIPPRHIPGHIHTLFECLEQSNLRHETSFTGLFDEIAAHMVKRGLIIILSDFFYNTETILSGFKNLKGKNHEIIVFHLTDPDEEEFPFRGQVIFNDLETNIKFRTDATDLTESYLTKFRQFEKTLRDGCAECHVDYVKFSTKSPFNHPLESYLIKRAQRRG